MIKAVSLSLGLLLLLDASTRLPAQSNPTDVAVNEAVLRQARTVELRQKLIDAKKAADSGDLRVAAKYYQDANVLVTEIGSGIDLERGQTLDGLSKVWLTLARDAQRAGNYREADRAVKQVLNADPQNTEALAFKRQNDRLIDSLKGRIPDAETLDQIPAAIEQHQAAGTHVQNGRVFYEMGKLDQAEAELNEAQKLDPQNPAALQYLLLIKQARYANESIKHAVDTQNRITYVEKQWVHPENHNLPANSNPFATTNLIYTGPGRQNIANKLEHITLESVNYD
jgi:tetratricopeptide (TPR) repeat protein